MKYEASPCRNFLMAAGTALALAPSAVFAQTDRVTPYIAAGGGGDFVMNSKFTPAAGSGTTTLSTVGTGYAGEGAVGVDFGSGMRAEIEGDYRKPGSMQVSVQGEGSNAISQSTFAVFANFWKDFALGDNFGAHVGGGIGWSQLRVTSTGIGGAQKGTHSGFAYQVGAGIDYDLGKGFLLGIDYRLLGTSPVDFKGFKTDPAVSKGTLKPGELNSEALVTFRIPLR